MVLENKIATKVNLARHGVVADGIVCCLVIYSLTVELLGLFGFDVSHG